MPWRTILRYAAERHGFINPAKVIARLENFAQPAEVTAPLELVRAGVILHARGLINSQAIQHNMDWVWPYWVEKQFNPRDISFIPRAFSISHINLTHRNWTAVGLPDRDFLPIVDPRGLVTPIYDGWSVDVFLLTENEKIVPSRFKNVKQIFNMKDGLSVNTRFTAEKVMLDSVAMTEEDDGVLYCRIDFNVRPETDGFLAVSLRPYNPEGISFIEELSVNLNGDEWTVNRRDKLYFKTKPDWYALSTYNEGDVFHKLINAAVNGGGKHPPSEQNTKCRVGMATGAAVFKLERDRQSSIQARIPLNKEKRQKRAPLTAADIWQNTRNGVAKLNIPDEKMKYVFESSVHSLILHTPGNGDVYPGPFTYKRFWFRDAALILNAMLYLGMEERVRTVIETFPSRQTPQGYFLSQDGEWDSNGEALWIIWRYMEITGKPIDERLKRAVIRGAQWIIRKRLPEKKAEAHAGLFPAGFSAEHLGPNNYYYWDDFWGAAGLNAAAHIMQALDDEEMAMHFTAEEKEFLLAIENSLKAIRSRIGRDAIPASPNRRLDSGAVGSLVAGYPLHIYQARDKRLTDTAEYLLDNCMIDDAFFHDLTHSGINPYLTLHIAQILLRANDNRYFQLVKAIRDFASPTGKWPEAIHPETRGGCMGDGEHVWAAAEWVMMIKNMFFLEEKGAVLVCPGIPEEWLRKRENMTIGPLLTSCGRTTIKVSFTENDIAVELDIEKWPDDLMMFLLLPRGYRRKFEREELKVSVPFFRDEEF